MNHSRFIFPVLFIILLTNCSNSESDVSSTNIVSMASWSEEPDIDKDTYVPFSPLSQNIPDEEINLARTGGEQFYMMAQLAYSIIDCFGDSGLMEALNTGRRSILIFNVGKRGNILNIEAMRDTTFFTEERLFQLTLFLHNNDITMPLFDIPEEYGSAEEYFKKNQTISYIFKFPPYYIFKNTTPGKTVTNKDYKELMAELEKFCQENSLRPKRVRRH